MKLTKSESEQVAEILKRRANDIASFRSDIQQKTRAEIDGFPGSVEMALNREIERLRKLANKVCPPLKEEE